MRALVVDDSRAIRLILARMLADLGMVALEAGDANVAEELLVGQGPFDLAIVDWNLPGRDGAELISAFEDTEHRPRVVVTTVPRDRADVADDALRAGADTVIEKPFAREEFVALLVRLGLARRAA
ncbi:MAG: response regulator [Planctomycetota bacterium]